MARTTLYLPDDLKRTIETEARRRSLSEAEVIRQALSEALGAGHRVAPHGGLFTGTEPIADRVDELLDGFGE